MPTPVQMGQGTSGWEFGNFRQKISGNFWKCNFIFPWNLLITYVNQLFWSPALQSDVAKWACYSQTCLANGTVFCSYCVLSVLIRFWCGRLNKLSSFSAHGKIGNFIIIIIIIRQLSISLCFKFMHYVQKNDFFLARLTGTLANSNENYWRYNSLLLIFPEILNLRKIRNPKWTNKFTQCTRSYAAHSDRI